MFDLSNLGTAGLVLLAAMACEAGGQISREIPTGTGLGLAGGRVSPVVRLSDTSAILLSPSETVDDLFDTESLLVVQDVQGVPTITAVAFPIHPGPLHLDPIVLDETTAVLPSPGPDGAFETADDLLILFEGLDQPAQASVSEWLIPGGLSTRSAFMRLDNRSIAWIRYKKDGLRGDDRDFVAVAQDIGPSMSLWELYVDMEGIDNKRVVELGEGRFVLRFSGSDRDLGTVDDGIACVFMDGNGMPSVKEHSLGVAIGQPFSGLDWPQRVDANTVVIPDPTEDGLLGFGADGLTFISGLDGESPHVFTVALGSHAPFDWFSGPRGIGVESDGTVILSVGGADGFVGSADDALLLVPNPATSNDPVQIVNTGAALESPDFIREAESWSLGGAEDVTLVSHYGQDRNSDSDDGLLVMRKAQGLRHVTSLTLFDSVKHVVPMTHSSALVVLAAGTVVHFARLDEPNVVINIIDSMSHDFLNQPTAISPAVVMTSTWGPPNGNFSNDTLRFWQVPATWTYGEASMNGSGHTMEVGPVGAFPQIGGPAVPLSLQGAPPSQPAWIAISFARDRIGLASDAEVLVSLQHLVILHPWFTTASGNTVLPLVPPTDQSLMGLTVHAQWAVLDPGSPRGYQLSEGLTLGF